MEDRELIALAKAMLERAYAPFSGFRVGAAILGANGKVYTGCNIENSSYGATICAERAAAAQAVGDGCRAFRKIAVISSGDERCTPCGICRQVLFEFSDDLEVLCCYGDGRYERFSIEQLLPVGFRLAGER